MLRHHHARCLRALTLFTATCMFITLSICHAQELLRVQSTPLDPLVLSGLQIGNVKPHGNPWDIKPLSDPDPYIRIYVHGILSWTSKVWVDSIPPMSDSIHTSVYRQAWTQDRTQEVMRVEVWDQDLASDDLIASFQLSSGQLLTMMKAPLTLGTSSARITLAWRSRQHLKAVHPFPLPQLSTTPHIPQLRVVSPSPQSSKDEPASANVQQPESHGTPSTQELPPCTLLPPLTEVDLIFKTSISLELIVKRGLELIRNNQARISRAQVIVKPCRDGFDLHSQLKIGKGWIRLKSGEVRVVIDRPKLLRKLPKTTQVKRRIITELCRRILKQKSPQCQR